MRVAGISLTESARTELVLQALIRTLPLGLWAIDPSGIFIAYERNQPIGSGPPPQILGKSIFELYPDMTHWVHQALAGQRAHWLTQDDSGACAENWVVPIEGDKDEVTAVVGIVLDVSKGKQLEHYLRTQLALVKAQQQVIRELSTPIIEVWDSVLMLPLIGLVDGTWTSDTIGEVLTSVTERHARFAILDLTGVDAVDVHTASYLTALVDAMRLVGTQGIITGIRPKVAQTMISLEHDLSDVLLHANLKSALMHCITQMSRA